jgi:hypothetical protein
MPEIAALLGVSLSTVHQWRYKRELLPPPDYDLVNGAPAWERRSIVVWAGDTGRLGAPALERFPVRAALVAEYRRARRRDPAAAPRRGGPPAGEPKVPDELVEAFAAEEAAEGRVLSTAEYVERVLAAQRAERAAPPKKRRTRS